MPRALLVLLFLATLWRAKGAGDDAGDTAPALRWVLEVDDSGLDQVIGLGTDAQGNVYVAGNTTSPKYRVKNAVQDHLAGTSDAFVAKIDPSGNLIYSTFFGGSGTEMATAMAVDPQGGVYVAGVTSSADFPATSHAFGTSLPAPSGDIAAASFLFKLNADGAVAYATYFANAQSPVNALRVDAGGFAYLTGYSYGGIPTTPGAYRETCNCVPPISSFSFFSINDAYLARFDPSGSSLTFSTYLGAQVVPYSLALAPDGSAYVAGAPASGSKDNVYLLNATGTALLSSGSAALIAYAATPGPDGSLYLAGAANAGGNPFAATSGAFQTDSALGPSAHSLQNALVRIDSQLHSVLAATYFGGTFGTGAGVLTADAFGNIYIGGYTSPRSLPTHAPLFQGFGAGSRGFVAELTADLSGLLFSSQFGDNESFSVSGLSILPDGSLVLGGSTGSPNSNVWVNRLSLGSPLTLRIDAVLDAGSELSDPLSGGETIEVRGSGFGPESKLMIGGTPVALLAVTPTQITAVVPQNLPGGAVTVQVIAGGASSNSVVLPLIP